MLSSTTSPLRKTEPIQHLPNSMQKLLSQLYTSTKRSKKVTNMLPVKRQNVDKNKNDYTCLITNKLNTKPQNSKRTLLPADESITFLDDANHDIDNQFCEFQENGQHQKNESVNENKRTSLQHNYPQNDNDENGENPVIYTTKEKNFKYPPVQKISDTTGKNDINNYSSNTELTASRIEAIENNAKDRVSDPNINNFNTPQGNRMRSSIKTDSGVTRKKWVTFNDIIQSECENTSFVDELYDEEESQDDESLQNLNTAVNENKKLAPDVNSKNVLNTRSADHSHMVNDINGFRNMSHMTLENQERLKSMIQQVRLMNEMITKARREISKFTSDRKK